MYYILNGVMIVMINIGFWFRKNNKMPRTKGAVALNKSKSNN
jgi:hypothetical protein